MGWKEAVLMSVYQDGKDKIAIATDDKNNPIWIDEKGNEISVDYKELINEKREAERKYKIIKEVINALEN